MKGKKRLFFLALGPILALLSLLLELPVSWQAQLVFAITVLAVVYWFSEAIELHVTGLMVAFLLIVAAGFSPGEIFPNYFDPVVMLLLGGFMLAFALQKYGLDYVIAHRAMNVLGEKPAFVLLGFMLITAFLSFWVSNTASAAIMIPIAVAILAKNKLNIKKSNFSKAFILGVAYAATAGGIGTLVGSTPNPLAARYLGETGLNFGFFEWMSYGLPFVICFLFVIWAVVLLMYRPEIKRIRLEHKKEKLAKKEMMVLGIFGITVLLWLTGTITGLSASVAALAPVLLLYLTRLVKERDFARINWPILSLIGSGIALGYAFNASGFDLYIASIIEGAVVGQPLFLVFLGISLAGVIVTMFASNTASAAIMIPLMIPLAGPLGIPVEAMVVAIAMAVSLDFTAPMGTPPNAIAYSTGSLSVAQMAKTGLVLSFLGSMLLAFFATFIWI